MSQPVTQSGVPAIIDELAPDFVRLADEVWDHPQLRWTETDAVQREIAVAEAHGFTVTRDVAGIPTAFMAEKGSGSPVIGFLGEYDALDGLSQASGVPQPTPDPANTTTNGHGCGHNLLGTGSLLSAIAVARSLEAAGLPGTVRYYGCPAEEAAAGKTFMVKGGAFDDVDAAVTWHPGSATNARQTLSLAYAQVYFSYTGVASHAGGAPHLGRSALDAAELLNIGVNFLREHMPSDARVHYAFTDAGGASPNVVQSKATLFYIIRATTVAGMRELYERVVRIAEGAALMTETTLEIDYDGACSELLPNDTLGAALQDAFDVLGPIPFDEQDQQNARPFAALFRPDEIKKTKKQAGVPDDFDLPLHATPPLLDTSTPRFQGTGSTDVADVSWVTPTLNARVATVAMGTPGHSWYMVAQGKLPAAHKGMIYAAKAMALVAERLFTDSELLSAATKEFQGLIAERPYDQPIPDGVVPPPLR